MDIRQPYQKSREELVTEIASKMANDRYRGIDYDLDMLWVALFTK